MMGIKRKSLFGGDLKWNADEWTASDDRVRGGKSQSHLTLVPDDNTALFHGHVDITALGSAGFASQRTTSTTRTWDLSAHDGIELSLGRGDSKLYTFILKDELPDPDPDTGRDRATLSWEGDFRGPEGQGDGDLVFIPWKDFRPTYRGKEKKKEETEEAHAGEDVKTLNLQHIRRMSLMMRSFFGTQEGDFALTLRSVSAVAGGGNA